MTCYRRLTTYEVVGPNCIRSRLTSTTAKVIYTTCNLLCMRLALTVCTVEDISAHRRGEIVVCLQYAGRLCPNHSGNCMKRGFCPLVLCPETTPCRSFTTFATRTKRQRFLHMTFRVSDVYEASCWLHPNLSLLVKQRSSPSATQSSLRSTKSLRATRPGPRPEVE